MEGLPGTLLEKRGERNEFILPGWSYLSFSVECKVSPPPPQIQMILMSLFVTF
jgi:hypothetical protein